MKRILLGLLIVLAPLYAIAQNIVGYPPGAEPITASATGTTGAVAATLSAVSGRTTYICGFAATSGGTTTPTAADLTITGTVSGTLHFTYVSGGATTQGALGVPFPQCIPASAPNTAIVVTQPAGGTGTGAAATTTWGYHQ
jgi:hypothetical protein